MPQSSRNPRRAAARRSGLALVLGAATAAAWPAPPAGAVTQTFAFTGAEQTFVVPAGVTSAHVLAVGGRGGTGAGALGGPGGAAAEVSGDVAVLPGETLYVEVGGTGIDGGFAHIARAFNGGSFGGEGSAGGGGGASDVRLLSRPEADTAQSLFSRLIVAGGGGAGGDGSGATAGGAGGAAGAPGASASTGVGGGAGTETGGGTGECVKRTCDGTLGSGSEGSGGLAGSAGGGGGGGLFGGAGGTTNATDTGAGGGGGSSLPPDGGRTVVPALIAAPEVQISYTPPAPPPGGGKGPAGGVSNAFTLLRPIAGLGGSATLVLDLPGKGAVTARATATRPLVVRRHGRRVHRNVRFTYGAARASATASGALELTIKPSASGRRALASRRRLTIAIEVAFTPNGGTRAAKNLSLTLHAAGRS